MCFWRAISCATATCSANARSRQAEIRENLPIMAAAVDRVSQYRGVIIGSSDIPDALYARSYGGRLPIVREPHAARILRALRRAALVTSGTATLETALAGVPQVAAYHGNGSGDDVWKVMKRVLTIPYVTLPNLIANRDIIPELLLHHCTADSAAGHLGPLFTRHPGAECPTQGYSEISRILGDRKRRRQCRGAYNRRSRKIRKWR